MSSLIDRPKYWRSLAEYENNPEFLEFVKNEFPEPLEELPPNSKERRRFLQLMSASFAFAGATACRWEEDKVLPHSRRPEGVTPGVPRYFNSAFDLGGVGLGIRVKSYDGRPIKVDGNPDHPDTDGACGIYEQASVLELYDPDRSQTALSAGKKVSGKAFQEFAIPHFAALQQAQGAGLRVLAGRSSSPSLADVKARFLTAFPQAQWITYEPVNYDNVVAGSVAALGANYRTKLNLDRARVILTLDADLFSQGPGSVINGKNFAATREPETGRMSRLYSVESRLSLTGIMADHRLPLRSGLVKALTVALSAALGGSQAAPQSAALQEPGIAKFLQVLVADLQKNRGASVVVAGRDQPAEVHALVHEINAALGAVGTVVHYFPGDAVENTSSTGLLALVKELEAGSVSTLLMLESNPVYNAPADIAFAAALGKAKITIHAGLYADETAEKASWHVPLAHFLEAWGDVRALDGTVSLAQPLIEPLYGARSAIELLAKLSGDPVHSGLEIVKRTHALFSADERLWRKVIHDGVIPGSGSAPVEPAVVRLAAVALSESEAAGSVLGGGALELNFVPCPKVYDGRYANNGWLQELPDPITKLTWDNALLLGPQTAEKLGIGDSTLVAVTVGGKTITVPALMAPGQAPGSASLALGYGRTAAGRVGGRAEDEETTPVIGVNAYALRSSSAWGFGMATVKSAGGKVPLATTQDLHAMDQVGKDGIKDRMGQIIREQTLEQFKEHPDYAKHAVHHPPLLSLWQEPIQYEDRKWGMNVDLNKCTGCNACVVACNAENNVSIVGKSRVMKGREMHWMRIDRYYQGDSENPRVSNQPLMCQHCEHAPCEQVCPVGATMHTHEGLNDMIYNRCIGTRYCSNNCPYKVRRFNYFNFNEDMKEPRNKVKGMVFNPEVTVRSRGVMEKCSFCVQRIEAAKIKANNDGHRKIKDGEVTTACQDTCPTGAIVFGDLNDKQSKVAELANRSRSYQVLGELNNRPRTSYLSLVRNPNPELA